MMRMLPLMAVPRPKLRESQFEFELAQIRVRSVDVIHMLP
jgi:hypothetical protein